MPDQDRIERARHDAEQDAVPQKRRLRVEAKRGEHRRYLVPPSVVVLFLAADRARQAAREKAQQVATSPRE